MILFSIIVHERPEVIVNQIDNFKYFNQGCQFVLHFSAWMSHIDVLLTKKLLASRDYIYFNDSQMWSGHGDGTQMKMHVLNYLYAKKIGIVFEYFCLHASNDMFVKKGLLNFIQDYDAGYTINVLKKWGGYRHAKHDFCLKRMMKIYGLSKILGGQVEGSFYKKNIIDIVADRIIKGGFYEIPMIYSQGSHKFLSWFFNIKKIQHFIKHLMKGFIYAKEEVYFATLAQDLTSNHLEHNYCYIDWLNGLNITQNDVDLVLNNDFTLLKSIKQYNYTLNFFNFFAVKRIHRDINDPIRRYITKLQK